MKFPANKILVIATRQLGDVLLTTPLLHSLRHAYPKAQLDALVYDTTRAILEGNKDIDNIILAPERPTFAQYRRLLKTILRRYDLAISTLTGDRPTAYALLAAKTRVGVVPTPNERGAWKRRVFDASTVFDDAGTHTVTQNLRLADLLGIPRLYTVVPPTTEMDRLDAILPFAWRTQPFAVLHPTPLRRYKHWHASGWRALAQRLAAGGLRVLISGGPGQGERAYVADLLSGLGVDVINLCGRTSLGELAVILRHARLFVGPDTAVTHLAAACDAPMVALYGPTNPIKWGPWPAQFAQDRSPYQRRGAMQRIGNVLLLQGEGECVPCHQEGCDRHRDSGARCLDELATARVIAGAEQMLRWGAARQMPTTAPLTRDRA
jgi:heptosyltransferase-3